MNTWIDIKKRSEIVNEQAMIEEIYERELLLNNNEQEDLYSVLSKYDIHNYITHHAIVSDHMRVLI